MRRVISGTDAGTIAERCGAIALLCALIGGLVFMMAEASDREAKFQNARLQESVNQWAKEAGR